MHGNATTTPRTRAYIQQSTASRAARRKRDWVTPSAGDTIHAEYEVVEARRSKSRPDRGLVRTRIRVTKQDGTVALTYTPLRMIKCRPEGQ